MKLHPLRLALWLGAALVWPAAAEQVATVTGTRVNVRGQPSLQSEVVTQLNEGDTVTILEEVEAKTVTAGTPTRWARIKLPGTTTVFVFAPYIDPATKAVKVSRLNVRGGPGENFSVLGRIPRGAVVKEVQTTASWTEIEAPDGAYGFVALNLLQPRGAGSIAGTGAATPENKPAVRSTVPSAPSAAQGASTQPAGGSSPAASGKVTPAEPETSVAELGQEEPVVTEPPAATTPSAASPTAQTTPANGWPAATESPSEVAVSPTVPVVPPDLAPEETPRRVVIREGRVVVAFSPQAPTKYGLMSLETKRLINYLHSEKEGLNLKAFSGKSVFVTGEELLDDRWQTPLIEVEDVRLAPAP